jgi:hypothetical protein
MYLMPITTESTGKPGVRVPAYYDTFRSNGLSWSMVDYGAEPVCVVKVLNIVNADHNTIAADPDVTVVPTTLSNTVGGALNTVQTALEANNIPSEWVTSGMTYQQVLKGVLGLFQFQQRVYGMAPTLTLFDPNDNITMSTQIKNLPAQVRTVLQTAAESMGFVVSDLTGNDTMRDFYRTLRQQLAVVPIQAFGVTF